MLAFSETPHFGYDAKIINTKAVQFLSEKYGINCIQKNHALEPIVKPYKCPTSGEIHESNNLKCFGNTISCFSTKCAGKSVVMDEEYQEEVKEIPYEQKILSGAIVQNNRFVEYDIRQAKFTFVKSQMNTGKTYAL